MPDSQKYYILVNPYIEGSMKKIFKADNSLAASKKAYESLSKYFNNQVPKFNFTLLKLKSEEVDVNGYLDRFNLEDYGSKSFNKFFNKNNFSHFNVSETLNNKKEVSFQITKLEKNVDLTQLIKNIIHIQDKFKDVKKSNQVGGNSSNSSSTESNSSSSSSNASSNSSDSSNSNQSGGSSSDDNSTDKNDKKKKSSKYDDDDDDSPDFYIKRYYYDPIYYWYYAPTIYGLDNYYFPMFNAPINATMFIDNGYPSVTINALGTNPAMGIHF